MKKKTSVSLTEEALQLLKKLAVKSGVSKSAMLEFMIREKAKTENID